EQAERHRRVPFEEIGESSAIPVCHPAHEIPILPLELRHSGKSYRVGRENVKEAQKLSQSAPASGGAWIMWTALTSQKPGRSSFRVARPLASVRAVTFSGRPRWSAITRAPASGFPS